MAAAVLTVVDALGLCLLSHAEHLYSIRPSAIINVYLLLTLVFDIARVRTLWLHDGSSKSVAAVFSSTIGVKAMVLFIEAVEKRSILLERYQHSSPEVTSGIYSRKSSVSLKPLLFGHTCLATGKAGTSQCVSRVNNSAPCFNLNVPC